MKKSSCRECLVVLGIHYKKQKNKKQKNNNNKRTNKNKNPNKPQVGMRASTASGRFGAVGIFPSKCLLCNTP